MTMESVYHFEVDRYCFHALPCKLYLLSYVGVYAGNVYSGTSTATVRCLSIFFSNINVVPDVAVIIN